MPTTVGHSLAGALLNGTRIFQPAQNVLKSMMIAMILANLADLDFIPGFFWGNPNKFHHGITHSLGATVLVGMVFGFYFYKQDGRFLVPFAFSSSLYFSHVLLDFFSVDASPPHGIPIFWPFFSAHFVAPVTVFSDVHKDSSSATFIQSLFVSHNAWTILREFIILGPFVLFIQLKKRFKRKIPDSYPKISG